ncbi:hypothetical protein BLA24_08280 [Streptomyces cinnamoneus]|uniref:Hydrogenase maturation protease n=1 Tax=Streptomyces cinnamoneus TaxID=53446 RepID=A0A2G1XM67_STRCJ|nr:hydrogenase maturation protease [Streptomyces cinnamoneus]PHQ52313.1 hypothetical protein BLA24_08280 [Streptomyces cinnamoneus]
MEPVVGETAPPTARVLIAGIGNVFLADDAFGPEVVAALRRRPVAAGVHVADFGIRGMDLAHRLLDGYDVAVFVDAAPRGGAPGTLYLIEPAPVDAAAPAPPDAHGMDPVRVLALAHRLSAAGQGGAVPRVVVLGCEPLVRLRGDEPEVAFGLSEPVRAAVPEAVRWLESLTRALQGDPRAPLDAVPLAPVGP